MKIRKILPLLIALFVLAAALPVHADATLTQYLSTFTGDEFYGSDVPTSGSYGTLGTNAPAGSLTVIAEEDSNKAYQYSGGATTKHSLVVYTYSSKAAENTLTNAVYQKMTARVKFSSTLAQTHLFTLSKAWNLSTTTDTGGVVIKNGGAYYYDMDSEAYVSFVDDGTLSVDTWYTVEIIYDFSGTGNYMAASVYDENGVVIDSCAFTYVSEFARYSAKNAHLRTHINFSNVPEDGTILVDDIAIYALSEMATITCTEAVYDEENLKAVFTFDDTIDTTLFTKSNIKVVPENPALDVTGLYKVSIKDNTVTVDMSGMPYAEKFTVVASGYALTENAECEVTTPEDPFEGAVTDVAFADENGKEIAAGDSVVATVTMENASNVNKDYIFVVTSWNSKDECVAIRALSGNIEVGEGIDEDYTVTLPAVPLKDAGSIIRISLVNDWFNMTPIGDVITFELGGADSE